MPYAMIIVVGAGPCACPNLEECDKGNGDMRFNPNIHHRRSIRLKEYDYSQQGAYFVTICVQNRDCLFGKIANGDMILNDAGKMIQTVWNDLPKHDDGFDLDAFIIMPNHIHGIIMIVGAGPRACPNLTMKSHINGQPQGVAPTTSINIQPMSTGDKQGVLPTTLSKIIHQFKSVTTHRYMSGVKNLEWQPFDGKLWQRNYYEHIIRHENDLNRMRAYISNNPAQWANDDLNPSRQKK